jgi:ATP-dependent protease ClpP protease subunit
MLIHQLKMGADYNKYSEIKDYSTNADTLMNIIKDIYLEYSNINKNQLEYLLDHDLWLNSSTCKQYGFVDIII